MKCKNCGSPLPSEGAVCKFCGVAMEKSQLQFQKRMRNNDEQRVTLLSEKYGQQNKIDYRDTKENKALGLIIIAVILVFLIIITILLNI